MTTFAKVNNNLVEKVIVAESSFFDTFVDSSPGTWMETSDQIRKNYAGIGYSYDSTRDAFIPKKPYPSWALDEEACQWIPPIPYPVDGQKYSWNEETQTWDVVQRS